MRTLALALVLAACSTGPQFVVDTGTDDIGTDVPALDTGVDTGRDPCRPIVCQQGWRCALGVCFNPDADWYADASAD